MALLIPVQYALRSYPNNIVPGIKEVAGHFDVSSIYVDKPYSLHTEYSYSNRQFNTRIVQKYQTIIHAHKKGVPQLWESIDWAIEFADFIVTLTQGHNELKIIEIHPPFSDYSTIDTFLDAYTHFEVRIRQHFPNVIILLENRCGTMYGGGSFVVSTVDQMIELSNILDRNTELNLKITLDIPQLLTAHRFTGSLNSQLPNLFRQIKSIRHNILGIHLWGKRKATTGRPVAHCGDLNSYFNNDVVIKSIFLSLLFDAFDDGIGRYFVPEVNSADADLHSIFNDLLLTGFVFI